MNRRKRIILTGPAASGKDYARKIFQKNGFSFAVPYTTRPKRPGEIHGQDYFFVSEKEFEKLKKEGTFFYTETFYNWHYAITKTQFENYNLFILTPGVINNLDLKNKENLIIYFDIPENIRKARLSNRKDADTVERRLNSDRLTFKDFKNYDIKIENYNFTEKELFNLIKIVLYGKERKGNVQNFPKNTR